MTARETIMEGNEGARFRDVIDNLDEDIILECMKSYAKEKCKELLEILAEKADEAHIGGWDLDRDEVLNAVNLETFIV